MFSTGFDNLATNTSPLDPVSESKLNFCLSGACEKKLKIRIHKKLSIFKMANNKVELDKIRSEEIVYRRFIKISLG